MKLRKFKDSGCSKNGRQKMIRKICRVCIGLVFFVTSLGWTVDDFVSDFEDVGNFYYPFESIDSDISKHNHKRKRHKTKRSVNNWTSWEILNVTPKMSAKTAVLIIAPPKYGNSFVENRWSLGKKTWEQYMNSNPDVDCYFLTSAPLRKDKNDSDQVWIEGNTIYVGDIYQEKYGNDRLLYKTIKALNYLLPYYTHFIRTNLNTFFNLASVSEYMGTHSTSMFSTPLWEKSWFAIGYGIIFTKDVAEHIINEYNRLESIGSELVSYNQADDCVITSLATGICPHVGEGHFRCCSALQFGTRQLMCTEAYSAGRISKYGVCLMPPITLSLAMQYCELAGITPMLYRNREGFTLEEIAKLYEYLLHKIYPEIVHDSLLQYVESLISG